MSVASPIPNPIRDINGNDLEDGRKSARTDGTLSESDERKTPQIIIPEPKRPRFYTQAPGIPESDRKSPLKDYRNDREIPNYPPYHWPPPIYAGFPHHYGYFPYRFHGFPVTALSDAFPLPLYQEHINAYASHAGFYAPFPLIHGVSPYPFPLALKSDKLTDGDTGKPENDTSAKSAFDVINVSPKNPQMPLNLASPSSVKHGTCLTLDKDAKFNVIDKKKTKDGEHTKYQCSDCQKSYSTFSGLSKHKQFHCLHDMNKEFTCKYCDKTYVSLGALKMHIRTHTLPCKCKICGKAFSRPWLLQGHIRTHTGEKPFSCVHCLRAFADRSNLRAHLQTHSDVKKYSCKKCCKTFSRMSLLLKHEDACNMVDV